MDDNTESMRSRRIALSVYWILTALFLACAVILVTVSSFSSVLPRLQTHIDFVPAKQQVGGVVIAWLLIGLGLIAGGSALVSRHRYYFGAAVVLAFLWLNIIREPTGIQHADFTSYWGGAEDIHAQRALHPRPRMYIYPPLLAVMLQPLLPLGIDWGFVVFQYASFGGILLLSLNLYLLLLKLGVRREYAAATMFIALTCNMPLLRTIIYAQINIHVLNCILLSILLSGRWNAASALFLALGMHLKVYPAALVLPFILTRQWRWLCWHLFAHAALIAVIFAGGGVTMYWVQFVERAAAWRENSFRNTAIDVFVFNSLRVFAIDDVRWSGWATALIITVKGALVAFAAKVYYPTFRSMTRCAAADVWTMTLKGSVMLLPIMLLVSRSIWEHHMLLVLPTVLVLLFFARTCTDLWWLGAASLFLFYFPANEIYPLAEVQLVAVMMIVALCGRILTPDAAIKNVWGTAAETPGLDRAEVRQ